MSNGQQLESASERRTSLSTLLLLIFITTWIALANLYPELITYNFLNQVMRGEKEPERAYGWPVAWYWRSYIPPFYLVPAAEYRRPHIGFWRNLRAPWNSPAPVSGYSMRNLAANIAAWLAMIAGAYAAWQWLMRRFRLRGHWRPRITTLFVLVVVSMLTLLANLSTDTIGEHEGVGGSGQHSFGWPFIWYRYIDSMMVLALGRWWDYSVARLIGNVVIWLMMLAVVGTACEWCFRRYQPRLRWSLRTMLAGVPLVAVVCAWYVFARDRARQEEAVLQALGGDNYVYFEHSGPQWLDLFGAERLRRRIAAAYVHAGERDNRFEQLSRLGRLRSLRFLQIDSGSYLFKDPATLAEMRQLRMLNVDCQTSDSGESRAATRECVSAIGKLTQLKRLRLALWAEDSQSLTQFSGLTILKSLALQIFPNQYASPAEGPETDGEPRILAYLPALPQLDFLRIEQWELGDQDLGRLALFPQLKSLDLSCTSVSDSGLAKLAPLESLEELAIREDQATAAAFDALASVKHLSAVHISGLTGNLIESTEEKLERRSYLIAPRPLDDHDRSPAALDLDDGCKLTVFSFEVPNLRHTLRKLREARPRIVIDGGYSEFAERHDLAPPWGNDYAIELFMRRLLEE